MADIKTETREVDYDKYWLLEYYASLISNHLKKTNYSGNAVIMLGPEPFVNWEMVYYIILYSL